MDGPSLLPKELYYALQVEDDQRLFDLLIKNPRDFFLFFEVAADDETWSDKHALFMKKAIEAMAEAHFHDKLRNDLSEKVVQKIYQHMAVLGPLVPTNISIRVEGRSWKASSFLWGNASRFLQTMIREQLQEKERRVLKLKDISLETFMLIHEFVTTGAVPDIHHKSERELLDGLTKASEWELAGLMQLCQDGLKKYVASDNAIAYFIHSHTHQWPVLKDYCMDFVNRQGSGVQFKQCPPDRLALELIDFRKEALEVFEAVKDHVTDLIMGGDLSVEAAFTDLIYRSPKLRCLDVHLSWQFSERLLDLPDTLQTLNLSQCEWLTNHYLKQIIENNPKLSGISLASNTHLNYSAWSLLRELKGLESLDISHCTQIRDEDFTMILQACRGIKQLYAVGCSGLSAKAFYEIGKYLPGLTDIDLSRTAIEDRECIDIAVSCHSLVTLSINRCPYLTGRGIVESALNARRLQELSCLQIPLGEAERNKILQLRPFLTVRS